MLVQYVLVKTGGAGNNELIAPWHPQMPSSLIAGWAQVETGDGNIAEFGVTVGFINQRMGHAAEDANMAELR